MLDERMMFALRAVDESRRLHRYGLVDNHERYARAPGYRHARARRAPASAAQVPCDQRAARRDGAGLTLFRPCSGSIHCRMSRAVMTRSQDTDVDVDVVRGERHDLSQRARPVSDLCRSAGGGDDRRATSSMRRRSFMRRATAASSTSRATQPLSCGGDVCMEQVEPSVLPEHAATSDVAYRDNRRSLK